MEIHSEYHGRTLCGAAGLMSHSPLYTVTCRACNQILRDMQENKNAKSRDGGKIGKD